MKYCNLTSNFLPSNLAPKLLVDSAKSDLSKKKKTCQIPKCQNFTVSLNEGQISPSLGI